MSGERPAWLPYAVILGAPCFAVAMTVGVFAADVQFGAGVRSAAGGVLDAVVWANALLAFLGATAGGALLPGRPTRRAEVTAAAGVAGLIIYGVLLAVAVNLGGVMI